MTERHRLTWKCRIAEYLGVVTELRREDLVTRGASVRSEALIRSEALVRWASRHVEQCERCLAERRAWLQVAQAMRELERPTAPDQILQGVMAKIAMERRAQAERLAERSIFTWSAWGLELTMALTTGLTGIVAAWSILLVSASGLFGRLSQAISVAYAVWKDAVAEVTASGVAHMIFGGLGIYDLVLMWTLIGLGITAGIFVLQQR